MLLKHCIDSYRWSFRTCVNFTPHFTDSQPNHSHSLHRAMTKGMCDEQAIIPVQMRVFGTSISGKKGRSPN